MRKIAILLIGLAFMLFAPAVKAQDMFGKNQVIWEKTTWNYYQSEHFDYYFSLDVSSEHVQKYFPVLVGHLEGSYSFLSSGFNHDLKIRPIVIVSRTHSQFEALHISGDPFMPEGIGAFAFPYGISPSRGASMLVLVVKPDFLPVLNRTIYTHELTHIFQFDMLGMGILRRAVGIEPIDPWIYEATADYMANLYAPYSRDDIRKMSQRLAAANVKNPEIGLPTLEMLKNGYANPYSLGSMVFEFLQARYGKEKVKKLIADTFNRRHAFTDLLEDISEGEFRTAESFDRAHRDFWQSRYAEDSLSRSQPYNTTDNFRSRQVFHLPYPYPMTSPVVSPNGKEVACLSYSNKNGIILAVVPALPREDKPYVRQEKRKKYWVFGERMPVKTTDKVMRILTRQMPPKPFEYIIGQELDTWPFNGSDLDWWQDSAWAAQVKTSQNQLEANANEQLDLKNKLEDMRKISSRQLSREEKEKALADIKASREGIDKLALRAVELQKEFGKLGKVRNVNKIAFFARNNRDHELFIIDANTGDITDKVEIPLDQAFSPKFNPLDAQEVYFSAAKNINRDIYAINLKTREVRNITNGGVFNSAPAISPSGATMAYVAFVGGFQKLFLLDLTTGHKEQLTFGRYNDNSPSWSSADKTGNTLVYTSDEKDGIWNLYTMDVETHTAKQWTDFYGGVFTPMLAPGENDRVVYSAMFEEDQYHSFVYPNIKVFDALLKKPIRTFELKPTADNMELTANPEQAVAERLDQRQLDHPQNPPARWQVSGRNIYLGTNVYYGMYTFANIMAQDLLANHRHELFVAKSGDVHIYDYTYIDQSRRWAFAANANSTQYPLFYNFYSFTGQQPRYPYPDQDTNQFLLNNVWAREYSATFYAQYPFNKWDRVELGIRPRKRSFLMPYVVSEDQRSDFIAKADPLDVQFYDFFTQSSGRTNIGLTAAFVHDTVLYSYNTLGPLHGSALRAQVEYGPGLNSKSPQYFTASADVRRYQRLTNSVVAAFRVAGMHSSRPSGDFVLLGGTDTLRTYPYLSVSGNRAAYGSAELRLPVATIFLFDSVPFKVRGAMFGDYAIARFSNDLFPTRREWAYGFDLQAWLVLPMNFEWAKTKYDPDHWKFNFRIGFSF